jgi:hypothetical protein
MGQFCSYRCLSGVYVYMIVHATFMINGEASFSRDMRPVHQSLQSVWLIRRISDSDREHFGGYILKNLRRNFNLQQS